MNKMEFMTRFGLEKTAAFVPGDDSVWLLPAEQAIPVEWAIEAKAPEAERKNKWESALKQPETKRRQTVFADDLALPKEVWHLDCRAEQGRELLLPVLLPRVKKGEAFAFHIAIPDNCRARLIFLEKAEDFVSGAGEADGNAGLLPNVTISADLGAYASLDIAYIHPLYSGRESKNYLRKDEQKHCLYYVNAERGASFKWTSVNLGDSLVERGEVQLNGEAAESNIGGASYVQDGAEQIYQSHVICHKPMAVCRMHNHGVVENGGRGMLVSVSDIDKGAHGTQAREDNRFMTLGDEAEAYADPTLLIDEYDVTASHAATIGQVDEEALFYLQSRGLSKQQAARLMTAGFLTPLFDRISHEPLREQLLRQFYGKLQLDDMLGGAEA